MCDRHARRQFRNRESLHTAIIEFVGLAHYQCISRRSEMSLRGVSRQLSWYWTLLSVLGTEQRGSN